MRDVIERLMQDHGNVERLFSEFADSQDMSIASSICEQLMTHSQVEEALIYPLLAEMDSNAAELAREQHEEAKDLIARIQSGSGDAETIAFVAQLRAVIEEHVEMEERDAFPELRANVDAQRLTELGDEMDARKKATL